MASRAIEHVTLREWFSAAELADLALPGMPANKRLINRRAQDERWTTRIGQDGELLVRTRQARGGGLEFHISLLPGEARIELARRGIAAAEPVSEAPDPQSQWAWFEGQKDTIKKEAQRRADIIAEIDLLESSGMTRSASVAATATARGVGKSTLWGWLGMVDGIEPANRLPALAPRRKGGGAEAEIEPLLWAAFKSDFLRPSAPTLASVYDRVAEIAAERGMSMPCERTFRRRLDREVGKQVIKLRREGEEALRRSIPSQRRSVAHLHAMHTVNIDGHKFDVFVRDREGRVIRPIMVAIQDIYSRKFLAWRIGGEESAVQTRLVFADLFRDFGIPKACVLDNGRAFASKWISGGAKTRFRFKIKEEEPTGLLTGLGVEIHWALPYRGQSKPIERGFRDMCDRIAKHPAFEGAYTGNTPLAKPENYGSRAIEWDAFCEQVNRGIAQHNAKMKRRTEVANGRSFDQVFAESYAASPIGKASPEQMRMALLAAEQKLVNRKTGEITLHGNRYWSETLDDLHGQTVTIRFDPDHLHSAIHLYDHEGRYLGEAPVIRDTGFNDVEAAKTSAKRLATYRKSIRAAADAEQLLAMEELAALQAEQSAPYTPEPTVIRPVRHQQRRGGAAPALAQEPEMTPAREAMGDRMARGLAHLRLIKDDDE